MGVRMHFQARVPTGFLRETLGSLGTVKVEVLTLVERDEVEFGSNMFAG